MIEKSKLITQIINPKEIEELFPKANTGRDWYIDPKSHQFVDKIIELWFEQFGYNFWNMPFEVIEWEVIPKGDKKMIKFRYQKIEV